ncbi:MAG: hypothetical protein ACOY3I_04670 [Verrucomicrobiota bacterium]
MKPTLEIKLSEQFRKIVRKYPKPVRYKIGKIIDHIPDGIGKHHLHSGVDIRCLHQGFFECRVGLDLRLIFRIKNQQLIFVYAGHHDQIKAFLKSL